MQIQENISLRPYNSFGIDAYASYFASFASVMELGALLEAKALRNLPLLILGGGSNILLTRNFEGAVLKNELKGIELIREDTDYFYVKAGAGERWHDLVRYCVNQNYAGIENLSLIPGSTGAAPIQNIGAYGVELKDCFYELEAYSLSDKAVYRFALPDCEFGYRDSVFKRAGKDRFVILNICLRLNKTPVFHTGYGSLEKELEKNGEQPLTIQAISRAVIAIRTGKLPDPDKIGNAGSFFKNPEIPLQMFVMLQKDFPGIVGYPAGDSRIKLAAGWLIEQCGWKGYRKGDAGVHAAQALVLVNYGKASGTELYLLSEKIMESVRGKFGVILEREVNII